jgi:hypothetical protein
LRRLASLWVGEEAIQNLCALGIAVLEQSLTLLCPVDA